MSEQRIADRLYKMWVSAQWQQAAEVLRPKQGQQVSPAHKELVRKRLEELKTQHQNNS